MSIFKIKRFTRGERLMLRELRKVTKGFKNSPKNIENLDKYDYKHLEKFAGDLAEASINKNTSNIDYTGLDKAAKKLGLKYTKTKHIKHLIDKFGGNIKDKEGNTVLDRWARKFGKGDYDKALEESNLKLGHLYLSESDGKRKFLKSDRSNEDKSKETKNILNIGAEHRTSEAENSRKKHLDNLNKLDKDLNKETDKLVLDSEKAKMSKEGIDINKGHFWHNGTIKIDPEIKKDGTGSGRTKKSKKRSSMDIPYDKENLGMDLHEEGHHKISKSSLSGRTYGQYVSNNLNWPIVINNFGKNTKEHLDAIIKNGFTTPASLINEAAASGHASSRLKTLKNKGKISKEHQTKSNSRNEEGFGTYMSDKESTRLGLLKRLRKRK